MRHWSAFLLLTLAAVTQLHSGEALCGYRNFTCSNGQCISAGHTCDGRRNCDDGSDEVDVVCDKAPSLRMRLTDVVTVRIQHKKEHGGVWINICDTDSCSSSTVEGSTSDGSLATQTAENCNSRGNYCDWKKTYPDGWKEFPEGPLVFVVERRIGQLAVWLLGNEDKATTVSVTAGRYLLRVKPYYWTPDMPVEIRYDWKTSLSHVRDTSEPQCLNGGESFQGKCICQPGFSGLLCDKACGPDKFGEHCEQSCSEKLTKAGRGCSGVRFSARGDETCAAGFQGPRCDQVCGEGRYGAGCREACGKCGGAGLCDPYTGKCLAGCLPGYYGASCRDEFTYLVVPPNITTSTSHSVEGSVMLQGNTAGSGSVKHIQVQYRQPQDEHWKQGALVEVKDQGDAFPFTVDGLRVDSDVELRAVLLDERARGRQSVPQVRVRTTKGVVSGVVAASADDDTVNASWQLSGWTPPVVVEFECESVMGCAERCNHSFGSATIPAGDKKVVLAGLLPAARYRLTVRAGLQTDSTTFDTALRAPNVTVSSAEAVWVTNTSALVKWGANKGSCLQAGAPMQGYRWQLLQGDGVVLRNGSTMTTLLSLENLEPGSNYSVQVAVANTIGVSEWTTAYFKTEHSAPSAPLDLTAYRWNSTTLSLKWRAPALPGGKLLKYTVWVDGLQVEDVSPDSRCAAWPDMLCHVAHRPRRGRLSGSHSVEVSATNDLVVWRGDEARLKVVATDKKPDAVSGLEAVPTVDSVLLRWRLPGRLNGDMHLFVVTVTRVLAEDASDDLSGQDPDVVRMPAERELPLYERQVGQLQPNATYKATVRCVGSGGPSDEASVQFATPSDLKEGLSENMLDGDVAK